MTGTVIVTGAAGFTGGAVCECFSAAGWRVVPMVRTEGQLPEGWVFDFDELSLKALESLPPADLVVHLATHVDFSREAAPSLFSPTCAWGTANLAALARLWNAHFILASGTLVLEEREVYDETSPVGPGTEYGKAKRLAEDIVRLSGVRHTILRISGIFGRNGPGHLGLNRAIDAAIDAGQPPDLFGSGKARRNYIYVKDLAKTVLACAEDKIVGTHLVAGSETISIRDMLQTVCDVFLPDSGVRQQDGGEAADTIVKVSAALPGTRRFQDALLDIRAGEQT